MGKDELIREAQSRVKKIFVSNPDKAHSTTLATAKIDEGLTCIFTQGEMTTTMDMPEIMGGDNKGPSPGFHARAAIAGCVAIGIKQASASENIHCESVNVALEMDFDDAAMFGIGENKAAPLETRLTINITSKVLPEIVQKLVERVLEMDPFYLALRDAQAVSSEVNIVSKHG